MIVMVCSRVEKQGGEMCLYVAGYQTDNYWWAIPLSGDISG